MISKAQIKRHVPRFVLGVLLFCVLLLVSAPLYRDACPTEMHLDISVEKDLTLAVVFGDVKAKPHFIHALKKGENHVNIPCPSGKIKFFELRLGYHAGQFSVKELHLSSGDKQSGNLADGRLYARGAKLSSQDELSAQFSADCIWAAVGAAGDFSFSPAKRLNCHKLAATAIVSLALSWFLSGWAWALIARRRGRLLHDSVLLLSMAFPVVFLVSLVVPFAAHDSRDIDKRENRKLSTFPSLTKGGSINTDFSKEFDNWFQDHLGGRDELISLYTDTLQQIDSIIQNEKAISYSDGWMFYKIMSDFVNEPPTVEQKNNSARNLKRLNDFCKEHGIALYVLFCPIKDELYRHHDYLRDNDDAICAGIMTNHLNSIIPDHRVVYPLREMRAAVGNEEILLHYKTDTHQTDDGAFVINQALVKRIHQDFPDVPVLPDNARETIFNKTQNIHVRVGPEDNFTPGCIYFNLGLKGEKMLGFRYNYYEPPASFGIHVEGSKTGIPMERVSTCATGKRTAWLIGDSYTEQQVLWLQCSFAKLTKFRFNNNQDNNRMCMSRWEKRLIAEKPDILILCLCSPNSPIHLRTLYK